MKAAMLLFLLVPNLFALDITTLDGTTYADCRVSRVFPDSLCVLWAGGGARVKFANLPESIRTQFGYNERQAALFAQAEAARQERERALLEAQRQFLASQSRSSTAAGQQSPRSPGPGNGANTGARYVGVNLAAAGGTPGNQTGNQNQPNQSNQFGGGNGRGGSLYVGVNMAPPGGIYGVTYGPNTRASLR